MALRIIKFIGLKVLEVGGAVVIIYYVLGWGIYYLGMWAYSLGFNIDNIGNPTPTNYWCIGLAFILIVAIGIIALSATICGLYFLCKKNWEWAGK